MRRLALYDLDGVLADDRHRVQYALARQWGTYFALMTRDKVWPQGRELYDAAHLTDWSIGYCTGRREDTREWTVDWLARHGFDHRAPLMMRPEEDRRPLAELKAVLIAEVIQQQGVEVILYDDDPHVIEQVNRVPGARAVWCSWYRKPERMVRRGQT